MTQRARYPAVSPAVFKAMYAVETAIGTTGLDKDVRTLVKVRASQINGCAYCIDMHWKMARKAGMSEERLYMLNGWREAKCYSEAERSALAWTEAVTAIGQTNAPDDLYAALQAHFSEEQIVNLTWAIAMINAWNRMSISFRSTPGE